MSKGEKELEDLLRSLDSGQLAVLAKASPEEPAQEGEPLAAYGFTYNVGVVATFILGYAILGNEVALTATVQPAGHQPQVWLRYSTPKSQALSQAERMVDEVTAYAARLSPIVRPSETLTLDDFQEHLRLRLADRFH